ncbi:hypothetical protein K458DRAFT_412955 [Lentithecium fluviatile CBS 122367]|uniref:Uncharacterized protein n=1 Tax=Lentithecium fluviatile CBS 122367 TaxID=1168545 RepID=A0A6G1JJ05_9PLEO|nr:hypothetical protein K458DRAFT_412955 [Lentithecium fluviatile CBS 122367]
MRRVRGVRARAQRFRMPPSTTANLARPFSTPLPTTTTMPPQRRQKTDSRALENNRITTIDPKSGQGGWGRARRVASRKKQLT